MKRLAGTTDGVELCRLDGVIRAAIIAGAALFLTLTAGCGRAPSGQGKPPTKAPVAARPEKAGRLAPPKLKVVGQKVNLAWEEAGQPKLKAAASELSGSTASGKADMKQVSAELYHKGKLAAKLFAPVVEADEKTGVVAASGGVTITSAVPKSTVRTVKTGWVKWYSREDRLVGNGGVIAEGPVAVVKAAAFVADTRLRTVRITAEPSEARAVLGNH